MESADSELVSFLRQIGKKGFLAVLLYIGAKGQLHYSEIRKAAQSASIIKSTSQLNAALGMLLDYKLLDQKVDTSRRPVRTIYSLTKRGREVVQLMQRLKDEIK